MNMTYALALCSHHGLGEPGKPFIHTSSIRLLRMLVHAFICLGVFVYDDGDISKGEQIKRFDHDILYCSEKVVNWRLQGGCVRMRERKEQKKG